MSGRRLCDLPMPPDKFRIDLHCDQFETAQASWEEDQLRAKLLEATAPKLGVLSSHKARSLAAELQRPRRKGVPETLASMRCMRDLRIRVVGALWQLAEHEPLQVFTVINRRWAVPSGDLAHHNPALPMRSFRSALNRNGAGGADGWLFAAHDGEFHRSTGKYQPHIHGVGTASMVDLVDGLRHRRTYRSTRATDDESDVVDPIYVSRKPLTNVPYALSYILKSYWPQREAPGFGKKYRIREPEHSEVLMWMDNASLSELTLLMKLSITADGLMPRIPYMNDDERTLLSHSR